MERDRQLLTYPLSNSQIRGEFAFTVEHLLRAGFDSCEVLFGFAWGHEYYPDTHWVAETMALSSVVAKVAELEARGIGCLGADDLYLKLPTYEFLFCNDSDIHLYFSEDSPLVEVFFTRWQSMGYKPAEWRSVEGGPKVRVRGHEANA